LKILPPAFLKTKPDVEQCPVIFFKKLAGDFLLFTNSFYLLEFGFYLLVNRNLSINFCAE